MCSLLFHPGPLIDIQGAFNDFFLWVGEEGKEIYAGDFLYAVYGYGKALQWFLRTGVGNDKTDAFAVGCMIIENYFVEIFGYCYMIVADSLKPLC